MTGRGNARARSLEASYTELKRSGYGGETEDL